MSGCTQGTQETQAGQGQHARKKAGPIAIPGSEAGSDDHRPKVRASKSGKWRALSLLLVHALIALHVYHWTTTGTTLAPLEPSEGMQLGLQGVVNAGLVFFGLTIVTTLVMGRWFCGWACHVVALQDACRWMLGKVGIRPRMINLGLLATVPWLAFVYMFLMPFVRRILEGQSITVTSVHLYTTEFWKTFPSWPVALLTFAVCGFAIVYFLGAKGFCNYGCPYGAMFGIADQLAPFRIRVTDACEGCGHCTAVCSSNVKVHQEVRDYGMVVDPGCMKCLDCVSVCPKDALYAGFGVPAIVAKVRPPPAHARKSRAALATASATASLTAQSPASSKATSATAPAGSAWTGLARWGVLALFTLGTYVVLMAYNGEVSAYVNPPEWKLLLTLTALSLLVVLVFRGKARRTADYSLFEEALLGLAFLGAMLAFRGLRGSVPLLFGLGLAALFAWASVQVVRLLARPETKMQRVVLKREGRFTLAGGVFAAVMVLAFSGLALAWREQASLRTDGKATMTRLLLDQGQHRLAADDAKEAVRTFARALQFDGDSIEARRGLAFALCRDGRLDEGLQQFERILAAKPGDAETHAQMGAALLSRGDIGRALPHVREAVRLAPERADLHLFLADVLEAMGQASEAARERAAAQVSPGSPPR